MSSSKTSQERCQNNPPGPADGRRPIAFAYDVDGVDKLVLNAEVLAEIFNGTIKTWDDPKIQKLNPDAKLPSADITVFFRSDESGTTDNTPKSLSKAGNGAWKAEPGKAWTGTGRARTSPRCCRSGWEHQELHDLHRVELRQGQQSQDRLSWTAARPGRADG